MIKSRRDDGARRSLWWVRHLIDGHGVELALGDYDLLGVGGHRVPTEEPPLPTGWG